MIVSIKTLFILNSGQEIRYQEGQSILDALNSSKVKINQECGGHGTCTTCLIITHSDESCYSVREEIEKDRALERGFAAHERLACQTQLLDSATIEIPYQINEE